MSRNLRWTRRALSRLDTIGSYIAEKNPKAAQLVVGKIYATAQTLRDHPLQGRSGRVRATRELVLADYPYIIVYRAGDHGIEVLTVMHTSQKWPDRF